MSRRPSKISAPLPLTVTVGRLRNPASSQASALAARCPLLIVQLRSETDGGASQAMRTTGLASARVGENAALSIRPCGEPALLYPSSRATPARAPPGATDSARRPD